MKEGERRTEQEAEIRFTQETPVGAREERAAGGTRRWAAAACRSAEIVLAAGRVDIAALEGDAGGAGRQSQVEASQLDREEQECGPYPRAPPPLLLPWRLVLVPSPHPCPGCVRAVSVSVTR